MMANHSHHAQCVAHEKRACRHGLLLPVWPHSHDADSWAIAFRAGVYLLALAYTFVGMSVGADRLIAAIEVGTNTIPTGQINRRSPPIAGLHRPNSAQSRRIRFAPWRT